MEQYKMTKTFFCLKFLKSGTESFYTGTEHERHPSFGRFVVQLYSTVYIVHKLYICTVLYSCYFTVHCTVHYMVPSVLFLIVHRLLLDQWGLSQSLGFCTKKLQKFFVSSKERILLLFLFTRLVCILRFLKNRFNEMLEKSK